MPPVPDPRLLKQARDLLAQVTPLAFDCGTLCGHKCCVDYAPDVGVYLLPDEIQLFDGTEDWLTWQLHSTADFEFAPSWEKHGQIHFMKCHKLCQRDGRPFECRTYPLAPYLNPDDSLEMRYAPWAYDVCPLTEQYPLEALQPAFVEATRQAWTLLLQDPDMRDHIRWVTEQIDAEERGEPYTRPL